MDADRTAPLIAFAGALALAGAGLGLTIQRDRSARRAIRLRAAQVDMHRAAGREQVLRYRLEALAARLGRLEAARAAEAKEARREREFLREWSRRLNQAPRDKAEA